MPSISLGSDSVLGSAVQPLAHQGARYPCCPTHTWTAQGVSGSFNILRKTWGPVIFLIVPTPYPLQVHIPVFWLNLEGLLETLVLPHFIGGDPRTCGWAISTNQCLLGVWAVGMPCKVGPWHLFLDNYVILRYHRWWIYLCSLLIYRDAIDLNHLQCFQQTTSFPSSPSSQPFFCGASKLSRPSLFLYLFLILEAKFTFLEGHLHDSLSWDNPWKTCEVFGVPNSFPFSGSPAALETPISALPLMLSLHDPGFSPTESWPRKQEIWILSEHLPLTNCTEFKQLISSPSLNFLLCKMATLDHLKNELYASVHPLSHFRPAF